MGPAMRPHRPTLEAMIYRARTGVPWRDLPADFGSWQTVHRRFQTLSSDGTLIILVAEADAEDPVDWRLSVDSTIARAHQHSATAPRCSLGPSSHTSRPTARSASAPSLRRAGLGFRSRRDVTRRNGPGAAQRVERSRAALVGGEQDPFDVVRAQAGVAEQAAGAVGRADVGVAGPPGVLVGQVLVGPERVAVVGQPVEDQALRRDGQVSVREQQLTDRLGHRCPCVLAVRSRSAFREDRGSRPGWGNCRYGRPVRRRWGP